jgi:eukaryotic-like serine/threonine-protein kinase
VPASGERSDTPSETARNTPEPRDTADTPEPAARTASEDRPVTAASDDKPTTAAVDNAPETAAIEDASKPANADNAPGTTATERTPTTAATGNAPETTASDNAPGTASNNAPETTTAANARATADTDTPRETAATAPATPDTDDKPATAATANTPETVNTPRAGSQDRVIAGRYRVQRRIGGGAMGVVYLAHDEVLDRTVAVKELLLPPSLSKEEAEQARKRSFREARLAARLQHRHAITVFNVVEDDGKPVLVMEYLPSRSLAEVLTERGSITPEEAARIGAGAASALAAAHAAGIVHRDVKPGNILIGENGTAKITDFGISRAADDGTITGSGRFAGTPAFLSPEAARGEPPSQASDVFSLGATLYTAVEGRFPYGDLENQMALLYAAAAGRYTPPTKAGPLTDALAHLMKVDPAERPTMAEAARELGQVSTPAPAPRRSRRRLVFAGLALVVVIAGGVAAATLLPGRSTANVAAPPSTPSPASLTSAPPPPTSSSAATPTTNTHTTTTTVTTTTSHDTSTPSTVSDTGGTTSLVQAVSDYYSIIPGNLDLGWSKLGPALQAQGKAVYENYWRPISDLTVVSGPTQTGPSTVEVTIEYTKGGVRYRETHQLGMIVQNGQVLINTDPPVGYQIVG